MYHTATECNVVRALHCSCCQNAIRPAVLKSVKDESHQEHCLETVSNNFTGGGGLKPVLCNLNPRPAGTVHSRCFYKMSSHPRQWSQTLFSSPMWTKSFQSPYTSLSHKASIDFTLAGLENPMVFYANHIA